jgi:chemotaxis signal transduction protein cheW
MSIHNKLRITLAALFVFIIGVVGLNFATFAQLDGDSLAVNVSGSLRMRAYQLAWLSARLVSADADTAADLRRTMVAQIQTYDRILAGLRRGDAEMNLRPASDEAVKEQLHTLQPLWEEYRTHVFAVAGAVGEEEKSEANAVVAAEVARYVTEVDKLVTAYDNASQAKVAVSKDIAVGVTVLAFLIFAISSYGIFTEVLRPIAALTASFREVAGKEGDLTQQITAKRSDEIGRIVQSFNTFVGDLRQIMQRAQACATEVAGLSDTMWRASIENSKAVECNAIAITNVAAHASELNQNIQMLDASIHGISAHLEEMQVLAQTGNVNSTQFLTSIEAVRACAQVAAAASEEVAKAAHEIASHATDSAAAIEQETASLDAFAATSEQLKGLAADLDELVGRFKV